MAPRRLLVSRVRRSPSHGSGSSPSSCFSNCKPAGLEAALSADGSLRFVMQCCLVHFSRNVW